MGTLVRATQAGFANGRRIRKGQEFILADGMKPGHWMVVVKEVAPATKADLKAAGVKEAGAKKKAEVDAAMKKDSQLRGLAPADPPDGTKKDGDLA